MKMRFDLHLISPRPLKPPYPVPTAIEGDRARETMCGEREQKMTIDVRRAVKITDSQTHAG